MGQKTWCLIRTLLAAYIVTGISLAVLAFLMYRFNLTQSKVDLGIFAVYLVSNLVGGFCIGKQMKERRFLWGIISGIIYFLLLIVVTMVAYREIQGDAKEIAEILLLCAGGGMLGGMLG